MALFGSKKKVEKTEAKEKTVKKTASAVAVRENSSAPMNDVILRPRITEKSGLANEAFNVYTFEVTKNATKHTVAKAIKSLYKVTPVKVRTINLPAKNVFVRGRFGVQSAVKKALVYLKKGEKIEVA